MCIQIDKHNIQCSYTDVPTTVPHTYMQSDWNITNYRLTSVVIMHLWIPISEDKISTRIFDILHDWGLLLAQN